MRSTIIVALALFVFAFPAAAAARLTRHTTLVVELRHGIAWQRSTAWKLQDLAGVARTPTEYAERRTRSVPFLHWIDRRWLHRRLAARHRWHELVRTSSMAAVPGLICRIFGSACSTAIAVARRESGFSVNAHNGQYLGIFQMGSHERATYATIGYSTAYEQIVAAHNYFLVSGWSPWKATAY